MCPDSHGKYTICSFIHVDFLSILLDLDCAESACDSMEKRNNNNMKMKYRGWMAKAGNITLLVVDKRAWFSLPTSIITGARCFLSLSSPVAGQQGVKKKSMWITWSSCEYDVERQNAPGSYSSLQQQAFQLPLYHITWVICMALANFVRNPLAKKYSEIRN